MSFRNFVHVLQILSKHSKFHQYESCVELRGTHFIFRLAFEIRRKMAQKLKSTLSAIVHHGREFLQIGIPFSPSFQNQFKICWCLLCRGLITLQKSYLCVLKFVLKFERFRRPNVGTLKSKPGRRR
jgi:hypothetical protein